MLKSNKSEPRIEPWGNSDVIFEKEVGISTRHCVKSVQIRSYFWSVFSCIRTEYGERLRISPYSVRIQENSDQK